MTTRKNQRIEPLVDGGFVKATVISLGNELLSGQTTNTNLTFIAERLRLLGIETVEAFILKDEEEGLFHTLDKAAGEIIVTTGGLGPTEDDITKTCLSRYYARPLEFVEEALRAIEEHFERTGRIMKATNRQQAYFPKGAEMLQNTAGTAPGMTMEVQGRHIIALPGPPHELRRMFPAVEAYLQELKREPIHSGGFRIVGRGESDMETEVRPLRKIHPDVEIASYPALGEIRYIFVANDEDALARAMADFEKRFAEHITGSHEETLEERVVKLLEKQDKTITIVESCTGGMIASRLVNVPGASNVFSEAHVLYSDEAKIRQLNINPEILSQYGAVSPQCVYELASNLRKRTGCDVSLAVSGIAGPGGETAEKPVGTVQFGLSHDGVTETDHRQFTGGRRTIRARAATHALHLVFKVLRDHED